jgi:hypothetical protein
VNSRRKNWFGKKEGQHPGKGHPRIFDADQALFLGIEPVRYQNGGGRAGFCAREIGFIFSERQIAGLGPVCRGKTGQFNSVVPQNFTLEFPGNLSDGKRHKC